MPYYDDELNLRIDTSLISSDDPCNAFSGMHVMETLNVPFSRFMTMCPVTAGLRRKLASVSIHIRLNVMEPTHPPTIAEEAQREGV